MIVVSHGVDKNGTEHYVLEEEHRKFRVLRLPHHPGLVGFKEEITSVHPTMPTLLRSYWRGVAFTHRSTIDRIEQAVCVFDRTHNRRTA